MTCAHCRQHPQYAPIRVHNRVFCSLACMHMFLKSSRVLKPRHQCHAQMVLRNAELHPLDDPHKHMK